MMKKLILSLLFLAAPLFAQNFSSYNGLPVARTSWLHNRPAAPHGNIFGDSSLIGWWPLTIPGNTAYDRSGNVQNGTWFGTKAGTNGYYSAGSTGPWAGTFDGSTNYIVASSANFLGLIGNAYSIGVWIKDDTSALTLSITYHRIVSFANGTTNVQLGLGANSAGTQRIFYIQDFTSGFNVNVVTTVVSTGWNHVVATSDGAGTYHIYLNGSLADNGTQGANSTTYISNTGYLYIGQRGNSAGYVNGKVNDVRIYNRALSQAEIQAIYNAEKPLHTTP